MKKTALSAWLFCLPALVTLILIAGWPLLRTALLSFTNSSLWGTDGSEWVGFHNFAILFRDPDWWVAVRNTLVFAAISVFFETVFGLLVALILNTSFPLRPWLRTAVLVPWAIPSVVSAKLWAWMFNDLYGVINSLLQKLHLIDQPVAWLAEDRLSMFVVILVDVWKTTPFMALLILAGLQTLPQNVFEAAKIDRIPPLKRFIYITLPLIKPALLVAVLFRTLDALRVFDLPYLLMSNTKSTAMMSVFARQQLVDFEDFGYGSAVSMLIFFIIALISILFLAGNRRSFGGKTA